MNTTPITHLQKAILAMSAPFSIENQGGHYIESRSNLPFVIIDRCVGNGSSVPQLSASSSQPAPHPKTQAKAPPPIRLHFFKSKPAPILSRGNPSFSVERC